MRGCALGLLLSACGMLFALPSNGSAVWDIAFLALAIPPVVYFAWWLLGPGIIIESEEHVLNNHQQDKAETIALIFDETHQENFAIRRSSDASDPKHPLRSSIKRPEGLAKTYELMRSTIAVGQTHDAD